VCVYIRKKNERRKKYRSRTIDHHLAQKHYAHTEKKKKKKKKKTHSELIKKTKREFRDKKDA
jgi:hypothetical protein